MASSSTPPSSEDIAPCSPLAKDGSSKIKQLRLFTKPSTHFTGREEALYQIHTQLMTCSYKSKWWDRMVIIDGPAGIGKSEVARMYAHLFITNPNIQNIAWIDSGNLASLKKSFSSLAKSLGIDIQGKEVERVVEIIYTYFSDHIGTGLFIFDNAKQMRGKHMEIFKFLPTHYLARPPLILITSRSDNWEIRKERMIFMEGLNEEEAVAFLRKRLTVTEKQKNHQKMLISLGKLATALQGYPLGLALTASNIEDKTSSEIDDIAARFVSNSPHSHKNNVSLCIDVVQEALGDAESNSRKLLNILAYLPADEICEETVEKIFEYIFKNSSKPEDFSALEKCSLIAIQNHDLDLNGEIIQPIQISKQVQKWARKRLHSMEGTPLNYLTQMCDYYCHIEDFTNLEIATTCLHSHLRKLNWPGDSVKYSILFAAKLVSKIELTSAHGSAWEMARDVHNFCTANPIEILPTVGEDLIKLLHLCQYFFNETSTHDELLLFNKMGMGMSELEKKWLESVGFYIKNNFPSVTVHDGKCEPRLIETLQGQITQKLIMKKRHHQMVVQKAIRNLLVERSTPDILKLEATLTYYKLLWKYCWHSECIESLVVKLRTLHIEFYKNTYLQLSEAGKIMYWDKGPLLYYKLVNLLLKKSEDSEECKWSSKSKSLFLVSFCAIRSCQILSQHLKYLSKLDFIPPEAEFLLQFITCLVMDPNQSCVDYLADTWDFSYSLYDFTHTKLALDN